MKRSDFLRMFLLGGAGATVAAATSIAKAPTAPTVRLRYLYSGNINGNSYYNAADVWERMQHNDLLELRLEPTNKYDHRAIEVLWQGHKLGYVPRTDNKVIYNLMKDGTPVVARLKKTDDAPWHELGSAYTALRMRVWMQQTDADTSPALPVPPLIPKTRAAKRKGWHRPDPTAPQWTEELLWMRIARDRHTAELHCNTHCTWRPDGTLMVDGWNVRHAEQQPDGTWLLPAISPAGVQHHIWVDLSGPARFVDLTDHGPEAAESAKLTEKLGALPTEAQDSLVQSLRRELWQPLVDLEKAIADHAHKALNGVQAQADAISTVLHTGISDPVHGATDALGRSATDALRNNVLGKEAKGVRGTLTYIRERYTEILRWWVG